MFQKEVRRIRMSVRDSSTINVMLGATPTILCTLCKMSPSQVAEWLYDQKGRKAYLSMPDMLCFGLERSTCLQLQ
jgi:hypothetical protein